MSEAKYSGQRTQLLTMIVASGATLSEDVHIGAAKYTTIHVPTVNSCIMYIRAAATDVGSYYRVQNASNNGDYTLSPVTGLVVYSLPERFTALDHVKIETGVAQTDNRTLQLILGW